MDSNAFRSLGWLWLLLVLVQGAGCGQALSGADGGQLAETADAESPAAVVTRFLEAVRTGDDQAAGRMLTQLAREKTEAQEMVVAPPGSETAKFEVHDTLVEGSTARVESDWTDLDTDGLHHTDRIVWTVRHGAEGWRISGMTTRVFADAPPVELNFEDPEDMMRKQQQAEEEIARRHRQSAPAQSSLLESTPAIR